MFSRRWRFGLERANEADLSSDRQEPNAETLSQAIRAASSREPEIDPTMLFGHQQGTVIGLRYYEGVVNIREMVGFVRQPQNPHDRNAVMVSNIFGNQIGHLNKELAAPIAYLMDNNLANIEGVVLSRMTSSFTMPVKLFLWGREAGKNSVLETMSSHGYALDTSPVIKPTAGHQSSHSQSASPSRPKESLTVPLTEEELKSTFDNLFEGLVESKDGEEEAAESVGTPLLLHQKQALSWMCARENQTTLPPFWEKRGKLYYNSLTCFLAKEVPEGIRGGILADDMGLGKTLTTIALILTNFHKGKPLPVEKCEVLSSPTKAKTKLQMIFKLDGGSSAGARDAARIALRSDRSQVDVTHVDTPDVVAIADQPEKSTSKGKMKPTKRKPSKDSPVFLDDLDFSGMPCGSTSYTDSLKKMAKKDDLTHSVESSSTENTDDSSARTTLIICPLSVISNWLDQFEQHVHANVKLNVYLYYGAERNRSKTFLSSQDVVITTYNVLATDFGNKSSLNEINWLRVVLDEGHIVRNPNTQMSKAVLDLKAQRRWILSGTPIQNSVKDLWMLLAFLRLKPFDARDWWTRVIQRPVALGDRTGVQNLRTLVKCITLRRTKNSQVNGRPVVSLPRKILYLEQVELTQREREEYELARTEGRNIIERYMSEGSVLRNYADVLVILMRLRQQCCHPDLMPKMSPDLDATATPAELRERLMEKLKLVLSSGCEEECSVCLESVRLPVITRCAHVYCRTCIAGVISTEQSRARCPQCRSDIKTSELVEFPQEKMMGEEKSESLEAWRTSSKVQALMRNLLRLQCLNKTIKCLVVSQFTRFLTILETPFRENGFNFVRLDGTMNQKKRAQVIKEFQNTAEGTPAIMLLSLNAGGVGLNLCAASQVFLMDPAWNPASEEQCIDRCHRLGQKRTVFVTKFIVKDSVEENMLKIQKHKRDLMEKAFGSRTSRVDDLRALLDL